MVILGNSLRMKAVEQPSDAIYVDEQDHYNDDWAPAFDFRDVVRIRTNQKFADYYTIFEEIGEGKFGKVYRCVEKATNLELAAKCIRLKKDADLAKVEKEVNIMTQMRHRCIAQIYDAFANSANEIVLIMEIVSGGELFDRVVDESYILTETAVAMIVYQICEAVRYIHSQQILHLDLKPENIMCVSLTGNQIKLIDFGLAQFYDGQTDLLFMAGTPEFAAPEVIKYEPLDFHTDMWSLGVITYILLSGQSPFLGDNIALTYCNVEKGKWSFCEEFEENGISEDARDFISKLLIVDKSKRMLPDECLRHPWIRDSLERARSSRVVAEKVLPTAKLRSYVKNKRFRRLVFGVLFINSVARMMNTLQEKKSANGVQYIRDMMNATADPTTNPAQQLVKSAFAKRRRNVTGEAASADVAAASGAAKIELDPIAPTDQPSTSQEGQELHRMAKRSNNHAVRDADDPTPVEASATIMLKPATKTLDIPTASESGASSPEGSRTASPKLIKRHRDKANRPKSSSSRKASSSEQAAKKPKQGSGSGGLKLLSTDIVEAAAIPVAPLAEEKRTDTATTAAKPAKLGGILAKFQQQTDSTQAAFVLPVACAAPIAPKTRASDIDGGSTAPSLSTSTVKVTLTKPGDEERKVDEKVDGEKPAKLGGKKLKKTAGDGATKKKSKSSSSASATQESTAKIDLKSALANLTSVEKPRSERKSADSLLDRDSDKNTGAHPDKKSSTTKSGLVGSLLQRLEQNDAPPIAMAVSSFIPTPKVEHATLDDTHEKSATVSKVLKIEPIGNGVSRASPKTATTTLHAPNLERKVVSEKKMRVKKRDVLKESSQGSPNSSASEREQQSRCELSVSQKTLTIGGDSSSVESHRVRLVDAKTARERDETRIALSETHRIAEQSLTSAATLDLSSSSIQPKQGATTKRRKKHLVVAEEESTRLLGEATLSGGEKRSVKKASVAAEKTRRQKATFAASDGERETVKSEATLKILATNDTNHHKDACSASKKSVAFSTESLNGEVATSSPYSSSTLEEDVAAFKALLSRRSHRSTQDLRASNAGGVQVTVETRPNGDEAAKLRTCRSLQLDDEENVESLLQAQQDAFDFSVLRSKLENRLAGKQTTEQDPVYQENYQHKEQTLAEIRSKLTDTGNIRKAMNKWHEMEKETTHHK